MPTATVTQTLFVGGGSEKTLTIDIKREPSANTGTTHLRRVCYQSPPKTIKRTNMTTELRNLA